MLDISKTEGYRVITYKGKAIIGVGETVKEALEDYLQTMDKTLLELEENILKLRECKQEVEEKLTQLK